jgi:Spy/CpxP family protein refolding chaperone
MHPGFYGWWKHHRDEGGEHCGAHAGHGHGGPWRRGERQEAGGDHDGGGFGVRRPLRFLAYKLDLTEPQVAQLAKILSELKTERAQAEVDTRRTVAAFADAVAGETFDDKRAAEGGKLRVDTAERLRAAVEKALAAIHALLEPEQRSRLAYLIRTGVVSL